jgi:hypothetical protein
MRTEDYRKIKSDLLDQLERNGTTGQYYIDLVFDYLDLWIAKSLLIEDIQERGVIVKYENGGGQSGMKKNDSIEQLVKVNSQMLKILADLGLKWLIDQGGKSSGGEPDDDDL